ncbi:MAG: methyltransferase domain-containing protein [Litoreibacter sp.]|nr:methyltransferase domain-containing protein [Litoreibacter sp.]MCY4333886.1 methyltransferase domain-containing protein [Litoreibacter sp.]
MTKTFLDKTYSTSGKEAMRELYDDWSESYDAEVGENGYATPKRMAEALKSQLADNSIPILDYGCGTGLSGAALRAAGFTSIDGMDPSSGMLEQCREKGIYRNLITLDLEKPLPIEPEAYQVIMAIGVISTGAGPASLMDTLIERLPKGGIFGLSLNDHALADPDYPEGINRLKAAGHKTLVEDYGTHLPGIDLKSMIYLFEKA